MKHSNYDTMESGEIMSAKISTKWSFSPVSRAVTACLRMIFIYGAKRIRYITRLYVIIDQPDN